MLLGFEWLVLWKWFQVCNVILRATIIKLCSYHGYERW
jgi:hypothetical protein